MMNLVSHHVVDCVSNCDKTRESLKRSKLLSGVLGVLSVLLVHSVLLTGLVLAPVNEAHALPPAPAGCEYPPQDEPDADGDECYVPPDVPKNQGCPQDNSTNNNPNQPGPTCGDPINITTGNVFETENDYTGAGPFPLKLVRYYNSQSTEAGVFGTAWSFGYGAHIVAMSSTSMDVYRPDHRMLVFNLVNNAWVPDADVIDKLTATATGWSYTTGNDMVETYDTTGKLLSITQRGGLTQTLSYDTQGLLSTVTGPFGRTLQFTYDASGRIISLTDPAGQSYTYAYDANNNLISVTYPDATTRGYLYENTSFPNALTGLMDENGIRYNTWSYDTAGYAISSEHAAGIDKISVAYDFVNGVSSVTDANSHTRSYSYLTAYGVAHPLHETKPAASGTGTTTDSWFYDVNGNVSTFLDFLGHTTNYSYDLTRNLQTSRTEAAGSAQARTISTVWDSNFRVPDNISGSGRSTSFSYDSAGRLIQKTVTDASTGATRTWTYSYNAQDLLASIDGPRTDVNDVTNFSYDTAGNLTTITNALGQTITFNAYDPNGRPLSITDPNGLVLQISYDLRGRMTSILRGAELTQISYDKAGVVQRITRPDGSFLSYVHDDAHRLMEVDDSLGNRIVYTLDPVDNNIKTDVYDPQGNLTRTRSQLFDQLNQLSQIIGAQNQTTTFAYDNDGNQTGITDALIHTTSRAFDALNRLIQQTDAKGGVAHYAYDGQDNITAVTDADGNVTNYGYDGFADNTAVSSPDTGTSNYIFDASGNVVSKTDAKGQLTTYSYDALNRLTLATYADGTTTAYVYDTAPNGIGRLASITDTTGTTSWAYDQYGRVTSVQRTINGVTYSTSYTYDAVGHLTEMVYPSGAKLDYSYDANGRVTAVSVNGQILMSGITYQPFGQVNAWTWGNGTPSTRNYDLDGQLVAQSLAGDTRSLSYDPVSDITNITDSQDARNYSYDELLRLTGVSNATQSWAYAYDANGNRTTLTDSTGITTYSYLAGSNRLAALAGAAPRTYSYDANGNTLADGNHTYTYDARNRLVGVDGTVSYALNGMGQRVEKQSSNGTTSYMYDLVDRLIAETDASGKVTKEYLYVNGAPVAVLLNGGNAGHVYRFTPQDGTTNVEVLLDADKHTIKVSGTSCPGTFTVAADHWQAEGDKLEVEYEQEGVIHFEGEFTFGAEPYQGDVQIECPNEENVEYAMNGKKYSVLYYVHTDQLGTSRAVTDTANTVVWRWDGEAFGSSTPNEDPDGDGQLFVLNSRFAGQYFDAETGLNYNYFRDYDSSTGRYIASDPIGLNGGMNTYAYVEGNPIVGTDALGLLNVAVGPYHSPDLGGFPGTISPTYNPPGIQYQYPELPANNPLNPTVPLPSCFGTPGCLSDPPLDLNPPWYKVPDYGPWQPVQDPLPDISWPLPTPPSPPCGAK